MEHSSNWYVSLQFSAVHQFFAWFCWLCWSGSFCRCAAHQHGVVLQLVEENPGKVEESSAEELLGCIEKLQALKSQNKAPAGRTSQRI